MGHARTAVATEELLANPGWLRGLAGRLVHDECEVDDLVHEAWVAVLRGPRQEVRHLPSWLAAVLQNLSRRRLRHVGRHVELDAQRAMALEDAEPDPAERLDLHGVRERVAGAVLELPEPFRTTVLEAYFEGLQPAEIARRHGIPSATVRTRLNRALHRLRAALDVDPDERAPIWGGLIWLARPSDGVVKPVAAPVPLAGLGLIAAVAALFVVAATLALGPLTRDSSLESPGSELEPRAVVQERPGAESSETVARPEELERAALEADERGSAGDQGPGCGEQDESTGALVAPLSGQGGAIPQPAQGEGALEAGPGAAGGARVARVHDADSARSRGELAVVEPRSAFTLLGAVAPAPTGLPHASPPWGRASFSAPAVTPRQRGFASGAGLLAKGAKEDEEDEESAGGGGGLPGIGQLNQGTGGAGALPASSGAPFQIEKHMLLEFEACPCLERIGVERWLAILALVESGRIDPRTLPDPCSLCDEPLVGELAQVVEGVGAIVMIRRAAPAGDELALPAPLPFEDVLLVPLELVRSATPSAQR